MPQKATIAYRGAKYEIGRAKHFYGIWVKGAPASDPIDRWPENRDGWTQAWARYTAIETPGSITSVEKKRSIKLRRRGASGVSSAADAGSVARRGRPSRGVVAAGLVGLGLVLGVIGLFPGYFGPQSLASQADMLVPHLIYLLVWAVSGGLIAAGARRGAAARPQFVGLGGLLGTGVSAVTLGMFLSDLGQVIAGGSSLLGTGQVLSLLGWLGCAAGSVVALTVRRRPVPASTGAASTVPAGTGPASAVPAGAAGAAGRMAAGGLAKPRVADAGPLALVVLAAIGAVAAFAPSWDSYTLSQASTGLTQTITQGNAFSNPGAVIAGNVVVMVAVIAVAAIAALWRPIRHGAVLLAGAAIPLVAQAISALIQVHEPITPAQLGISSSLGVTISAQGLTPIFWVYCVFVISLLVSCAWMLTAPRYLAMPTVSASPAPSPHQPIVDEDRDSDDDSGDHANDSDDDADDSDDDADDSDGDASDDAESTYA